MLNNIVAILVLQNKNLILNYHYSYCERERGREERGAREREGEREGVVMQYAPGQGHRCDPVSPLEQSPVAWSCSALIFSALFDSHRDELPSHGTGEYLREIIVTIMMSPNLI